MSEVQKTITLPAASAALSDGVQKLVAAVIANHKLAAGSVITELSLDVTEAVKDLGPVLSSAGLLGGEISADPIGVAEAFAVAGFEFAKALKAAPAAAPLA